MTGRHESFTPTVPSLNFSITNQRITGCDNFLAFLAFQARMVRTFVWTKVPKPTCGRQNFFYGSPSAAPRPLTIQCRKVGGTFPGMKQFIHSSFLVGCWIFNPVGLPRFDVVMPRASPVVIRVQTRSGLIDFTPRTLKHSNPNTQTH